MSWKPRFGVSVRGSSNTKSFLNPARWVRRWPTPASSAPYYERAVGYTYDIEKIVVVDGEIHRVPIQKHIPPEFNAIRFWLCNRRRDRCKDVSPLGIGVDEKNPLAAWFKQFEGTAMRLKPRELPEPEPVDADYEDVTGQPADAPPPRPKGGA